MRTRRRKFIRDVMIRTPLLKMAFLLLVLWIPFSTGLHFAELGAEGTPGNGDRF